MKYLQNLKMRAEELFQKLDDLHKSAFYYFSMTEESQKQKWFDMVV